ncbi:MAG: F0F1 ATP synthase subunit alpha, partial [Cyanobacteria bacterium P01_F01_bin.4]
PVMAQIALLLLLNGGHLDNCSLDKISDIETQLMQELPRRLPEIWDCIQAGNPLAEDERQAIFTVAEEVRSQILANSPQTA